jgi:hypothetical protein
MDRFRLIEYDSVYDIAYDIGQGNVLYLLRDPSSARTAEQGHFGGIRFRMIEYDIVYDIAYDIGQ